MADPNVEALKPVYADWRRGDWSSKFEGLLARDFEWRWSDEFGSLADSSGGADSDPRSWAARLREWLSTWDDWRCEAEDYVPIGDHVLVLCRYSGTAKSSGVPVDVEGAHLWTLEGGTPKRLVVYSSRDQARAAAGL